MIIALYNIMNKPRILSIHDDINIILTPILSINIPQQIQKNTFGHEYNVIKRLYSIELMSYQAINWSWMGTRIWRFIPYDSPLEHIISNINHLNPESLMPIILKKVLYSTSSFYFWILIFLNYLVFRWNRV